MLPLCCDDTVEPERRPVHTPVEVVTQYASAELIGRIAYDGYEPGDDPNWQESGAPSQSAYGRWCRHLCGMACLRMVLMHRDGQAPSLFQLLAGARQYGAYVKEDNGTCDDIKGLIYAPFAQYAQDTHDLPATVHGTLDISELVDHLDAGRMVMASVAKEIRRPALDPARRGGHLVLAIGRQRDEIVFRNPSGHTRQAREAALPVGRFDDFFGGRGLSLDLRRPARRTPADAPAVTGTASTGPVASTQTT
ncbi:C39 family peptidase [Streptomyces umbrinus]|uniref:C39 family peptidase n=1 Tax=Streptomyces umbrinus TaxID=67370 RepID=UPI0033C236D2